MKDLSFEDELYSNHFAQSLYLYTALSKTCRRVARAAYGPCFGLSWAIDDSYGHLGIYCILLGYDKTRYECLRVTLLFAFRSILRS